MEMKCPKCSGDTIVKETRDRASDDIPIKRRKRECVTCRARYKTFELIMPEERQQGGYALISKHELLLLKGAVQDVIEL